MLTAIPGIGEQLAERIVTLRDQRQGFVYLEELKLVPGIGDKTYGTLLEYLDIPRVP